jgi:hypothetical protein
LCRTNRSACVGDIGVGVGDALLQRAGQRRAACPQVRERVADDVQETLIAAQRLHAACDVA